ncbi:MAG: hypothetical protein II757_04795 [Bacteroidales bacterium]|nr:hypothetical protein [Bacteroidales bacterium]
MKKKLPVLSILLAIVVSLSSCRKVDFDTDSALSFSTDTLTFDTVFTTVGSVTQNFRVYNPYNYDIKVDIELAGGERSNFSINVDGVAGTFFRDVEIPAKDSIFVHVKVNVDPNDQRTPFLVTDSVVFYHGKTVQDVDLVAFGQNAHFIVADQGSGSLRYKIVAHEHEVTHWTNDLPYVIYGGYAAVDSLGTLIIDPGTTIYFHSGAGLWVYRYGNIQAVGTAEEPIVFRGDRMSQWYETDYSQWDRIWINEGTADNRFEHVEITHAFIGMQVEALSEYLGGRTILRNCVIHHTYNSGLLARAARIVAENCEISDNGECSAELHIGEYDFKHVTIANYYSHAVRNHPALYVATNYTDGYYNYVGDLAASFTNCIVYGSRSEDGEVGLGLEDGMTAQVGFRNCLLRMPQESGLLHDCIRNQDPKFAAAADFDFTLTPESPAIDAGLEGLGITTDLTGAPRDSHPDIGAYEFGSRRLVWRR